MADNITQWIDALTHGNDAARAAAAEKLAHAAEGAQAAAVPLVQACGDACEEVTEWVTAALENLGPPRADDLPLLAALAKHETADVAFWAVTLIGRAGSQAASHAQGVVTALQKQPDQVRRKAAWALGELQCREAQVIDALRAAAAGSDKPLARAAHAALELLSKR
jgi:hypothetical protein